MATNPEIRKRKRSGIWALVAVLVIIGLAVILYYHFAGFATDNPVYPSGQAPQTKAPAGVEKPESAKPLGKQDSGSPVKSPSLPAPNNSSGG